MQERGSASGQYSHNQIGQGGPYSIFALAILLSFVWHIFWLSAVNIIVMPNRTKAVKFSRVSFLGPLLTKGVMEITAKPKEQSFLEKRYVSLFDNIADKQPAMTNIVYAGYYEEDAGLLSSEDEKLKGLIDDSVSGPKLEPLYKAEEY